MPELAPLEADDIYGEDELADEEDDEGGEKADCFSEFDVDWSEY